MVPNVFSSHRISLANVLKSLTCMLYGVYQWNFLKKLQNLGPEKKRSILVTFYSVEQNTHICIWNWRYNNRCTTQSLMLSWVFNVYRWPLTREINENSSDFNYISLMRFCSLYIVFLFLFIKFFPSLLLSLFFLFFRCTCVCYERDQIDWFLFIDRLRWNKKSRIVFRSA